MAGPFIDFMSILPNVAEGLHRVLPPNGWRCFRAVLTTENRLRLDQVDGAPGKFEEPQQLGRLPAPRPDDRGSLVHEHGSRGGRADLFRDTRALLLRLPCGGRSTSSLPQNTSSLFRCRSPQRRERPMRYGRLFL